MPYKAIKHPVSVVMSWVTLMVYEFFFPKQQITQRGLATYSSVRSDTPSWKQIVRRKESVGRQKKSSALAHLLRSDWARTCLLCVEKMVRQQTAPATEVEMEIKLMSLITFFGQNSSVASITMGPQKIYLSLIRWTQHWMR